MAEKGTIEGSDPAPMQEPGHSRKPRRRHIVLGLSAALATALLAATWLGAQAFTVRAELTAVSELAPRLKAEIIRADAAAAAATVEELRTHSAQARSATDTPLWSAAGAVPWVGPNFSALRDVAESADEVAQAAAGPLLGIYQTLDWQSLAPGPEGVDLAPLRAAQPNLAQAAEAIGSASGRLDRIDSAALIPQLSGPLVAARDEVSALNDSVRTAADVALIAPAMLGGEAPRSYLLLVQNNAEARATGGIPGALAILNVDKGKLTLGPQAGTGDIGTMSPVVPVDPEQQEIYSGRLGKFIQSVNLTPDFPTAAATAQAMWERTSGQRVDGVISLDPVTLSYILGATGPIKIPDADLMGLSGSGLPSELSAGNVVQTLLSDVYAKIGNPALQDAYFAGVAQETFLALSRAGTDSKKLLDALARGTNDGRLLLHSNVPGEQQVLQKYRLSGSVSGPGIAPGQFGAYFNDATGAKMDYYVKRTVQLIPACPADPKRMTLRVTSTNNAPADAATSLPSYVTGGGIYGVSPGSVQTNIVAYGPPHSQAGSVTLNGAETAAAAHFHGQRPVRTVGMTLVPGQSGTVDFTFENVDQDVSASLAVTPGVQSVSDRILPALEVSCAS